jgi:hypothetical protein
MISNVCREQKTQAQQKNTIMALLSIAIVGKTNEPIYLKEVYKDEEGDDIGEGELFGLSFSTGSSRSQNKGSGGFNCGLKQQFILHAALDRFDQLAGPPPGFGWRDPAASGPDAMFVGCLCPVEESRVYGESNLGPFCGHVEHYRLARGEI